MQSPESFVASQCVHIDIPFSEILEVQKDIMLDNPKDQDTTEIRNKVSFWVLTPSR